MGLRPQQGVSGSFSNHLRLVLFKPRIRLNNLKTNLRFPCLGLNPIIDSINLLCLAGENLYPDNLDCFRCNRADIRKFAQEAKELGIQYIGVCCGNASIFTREVAEVYGREPPASKYRTDMSLSFAFSDTGKHTKKDKFRQHMTGETK